MKNLNVIILSAALLMSCKESVELVESTLNLGKVEKVAASSSSSDDFFQIAILPDTQYYTAEKHGGSMNLFKYQIDWILANVTSSRIKYVAHLGDVVDHGDDGNSQEWINAKNQLYRLKDAKIPFGVAVGNHDQTPYGNPMSPGTNSGYGVYFGKNVMKTSATPWYKDAYGSSNNSDNHYDFFEYGAHKFMVLYLEYNNPSEALYNANYEAKVFHWADSIIQKFPDRKVIIVSHSILKAPTNNTANITTPGTSTQQGYSSFTSQGSKIYHNFKKHKNVIIMLCGHISGEGYRRDVYKFNNGQDSTVIKSFLSDYQSRPNGGNGYMRLMRFNLTKNTLSVKTFAPRLGANILEEDADSKFTVKLFE